MKFPNVEKALSQGQELMALKLAKATHEFWLLDMTRKGWRPGLETDTEKKVHAWLVGWKRLPKEVQEDYLKRTRAIPWILWRADLEPVMKAESVLDLLSRSGKKGGKDGAGVRRSPKESKAGSKPREGGGPAEQQEKQEPAAGSAEGPGSGPGTDPSSSSGEGSGQTGSSSEGGPGKES